MEISELKKYTNNLDAYTLKEVDELTIMTADEQEMYQNEIEYDSGNLSDWDHVRAIITFKHQIEEWKELFFLLKSDHELQDNWQTNEWIIKARQMGVNV